VFKAWREFVEHMYIVCLMMNNTVTSLQENLVT